MQKCLKLIAMLLVFSIFTILCVNYSGAADQNNNFKFISCKISESSIYTINLKGARYGKDYNMIIDKNTYDNLCPKVKAGDLINITYRQEKIKDEGDGYFF